MKRKGLTFDKVEWFADAIEMGAGPGTANIFRKMVELPEVGWSKDEDKDKKKEDDESHLHSNTSSIQDPKQSTISDFMTKTISQYIPFIYCIRSVLHRHITLNTFLIRSSFSIGFLIKQSTSKPGNRSLNDS